MYVVLVANAEPPLRFGYRISPIRPGEVARRAAPRRERQVARSAESGTALWPLVGDGRISRCVNEI